jgi:hypothetical protein
MRRRWSVVLPIIGLLLFGVESYHSIRMNRDANMTRYQYWSAIKLDTDPLGRHESAFLPCRNDPNLNCAGWDPVVMWVHPGLLTKSLIIAAFPAFVLGAVLVRGLGHLGANEVLTFGIFMPVLVAAWFYFVGRMMDKFAFKRAA